MSGIIEAAGLAESDVFTMQNVVRGIEKGIWDPTENTKRWIGEMFRRLLNTEPLRPGDRVTFPFGKGEVFEVLLVHGDWVVGVGEDGVPTTLSAGAVERVTTGEQR